MHGSAEPAYDVDPIACLSGARNRQSGNQSAR
jgi:hypothetical protein